MICCQKNLWKLFFVAKNNAGLPKITFGFLLCFFICRQTLDLLQVPSYLAANHKHTLCNLPMAAFHGQVQVRVQQGTHRAPSLAKLLEREHGSPPPLVLGGEALSLTPGRERQIAHQVPDPAEALALMTSACWALHCTTHLLDKAVRSLLGENTRNSRGNFCITLPEQRLYSLLGRVVNPALYLKTTSV